MSMPQIKDAIENAGLNDKEYEIAKNAIGRGGKLRTSKPKDPINAYVWRMIAFHISTNPQHHCIPATVDLMIPEEAYQSYEGDYNFKKKKKYLEQELDPIVDKIVDQIPKNQWHGVKRWGRALGAI